MAGLYVNMVDLNRQDELRAAIELLYFGYRAFTAHPDRILEQRGLGRVHHRILYFVGRNPEISINALLKILGVTKQSLNSPLRQLLKMKLVEMQAAAHDRRIKQLSLTAEGGKLESQLTGTQLKQLDAIFDAAGPRAAAGWRAVMQALSDRQ